MAKIPITTTLKIENFSGGNINIASSKITNAIYDKYPNGSFFVTQRPAVNIFQDASVTVADIKGRGNYYWEEVDATYFVNDDTVYKSSYSNPLGNLITSGTERVYFAEVGDYLVLIDPEGNKGYYISSATSTTLTEITDVDFPPKQTPALTLAPGAESLNGVLYVLATNGEIWNCDTEDPTSWGGLSFLTAEAETDGGVFIAKHLSNIVVAGNRSIEFFYDASNPTGSPLSPRLDFYHEIGAISDHTFWAEAGSLYFLGLSASGQVSVYVMSGFQVSPISSPDLDSFLTTAVTQDAIKITGSGFSTGGRTFYITTFYNLVDSIVTETSLVYDAFSGTWGCWELMHDGIDDFPLISWTKSNSTRLGEGMLSNGDLVTIYDDFNPQDLTLAQIYIDSGYVNAGYISDTGQTGVNISMEVITGHFDAGSRERKFLSKCRYIGTTTDSNQTLTVQWSDESNDNYNAGKTIDTSIVGQQISRLGSARQRNFKITYAGSEKIELEGLEIEVGGGIG